MDYDRLYASAPVNKQSALVTSIYSEEDSETKYLIAQWQYLHDCVQTSKKYRTHSLAQVKKMGLEMQAIQNKLRELKQVIKNKGNGTIERHFMDACKRELPPAQFNRLLKLACDSRGDYVKVKE
jgi:long-subunit acyl-CoA synthetase (AMP-forming)